MREESKIEARNSCREWVFVRSWLEACLSGERVGPRRFAFFFFPRPAIAAPPSLNAAASSFFPFSSAFALLPLFLPSACHLGVMRRYKRSFVASFLSNESQAGRKEGGWEGGSLCWLRALPAFPP